MRPQVDERAEALRNVERAFGAFMSRSALPRLRQRLVGAVGAGLDFSAFPILGRIALWGPIRPSDLADRVGFDLSTVSRRIAELERARLVRRTPDPHDGRAQLVETTSKGARIVGRLREARSAMLEEALGRWSTDDIEALAGSLERFANALADVS
jgi:DNA-binding MarR family transcriptional regulator